MKIKYSELTRWEDQIMEEQVKWVTLPAAPDADLNAFRAGLRMGMREILATLKLQGKIEIDYQH